MKKNPKILFIWTKNSGVVWYRIIQFAAAIARVGKMTIGPEGDVSYPPWNPHNELGHQWEYEMGQNLKVATDFFSPYISRADVIVFQTVATNIGYAIFATCKDLGKKVLTTIDDMESFVPYQHAAFIGNEPGNRPDHWVQMQLSASDAVICSTKYLADKIREVNPNCYVVPNAINFDLWDKVKKPNPDGKVRIGWAGGATHQPDLAIIEEPCNKIAEKYKGKVEFVFIGCPLPWATNREGFICKTAMDGSWVKIDKYHHFLGSLGFDIGLAPLRDNVFNRAKSNLRWLEYSALKIPTLASYVEPFKHITGYPCENESDWFHAMELLIEHDKERHDMADTAYCTCKKHWDVNVVAKEFLKILKGVYHNEPVKSPLYG